MKIQIAVLAAAVLCLAGAARVSAQQTAAAPERIVAKIDASQTALPVSKYVFGMFIEHIGKTMYGRSGLKCSTIANSISPSSPRSRPATGPAFRADADAQVASHRRRRRCNGQGEALCWRAESRASSSTSHAAWDPAVRPCIGKGEKSTPAASGCAARPAAR